VIPRSSCFWITRSRWISGMRPIGKIC
jgi:hypothetical protein